MVLAKSNTEPLRQKNYLEVLSRRDARFDGQFYFGVRTTKVYCRPVCAARPLLKNVIIFNSAAAAERAGFRPCLRCRPDAQPGAKVLLGTSNVVSRALQLIERSIHEDVSYESARGMNILSERLGISSRHLRRLFMEHLGATPVAVLQASRMHWARQMLEQTVEPISQVALLSGWGSIRRFNESFKARYGVAPGLWRKQRGTRMQHDRINFVPGAANHQITNLCFRIPVFKPYNWPEVIKYLKRHEVYGVEQISDTSYVRFIPQGNGYGHIRVHFAPKSNHIIIESSGIQISQMGEVVRRLKFLFDCAHNPSHLPQSTAGVRGFRVPGSFCSFESAVGIILSQLVSCEQARRRTQILVERFGRKIAEHVYEFPSPKVLREAPIIEIGTTRGRAQAIQELAKRVHAGDLNLSPGCDWAATREQLLQIKGIGPWTVEMMAMRCWGDSDAFPKGDLVVRQMLDGINMDEWSSQKAYLTHFLWWKYGMYKAQMAAPVANPNKSGFKNSGLKNTKSKTAVQKNATASQQKPKARKQTRRLV